MQFSQTFRNIKRAREMVLILLKYGFDVANTVQVFYKINFYVNESKRAKKASFFGQKNVGKNRFLCCQRFCQRANVRYNVGKITLAANFSPTAACQRANVILPLITLATRWQVYKL